MIKCHCQKEMERTLLGPSEWACPECVTYLIMDSNNNIVSYVMYWDVDPQGTERYKLTGQRCTTDYQVSCTRVYYSYSSRRHIFKDDYQLIWHSDSFIEIPIQDNILQVGNLISRLRKMVVFS